MDNIIKDRHLYTGKAVFLKDGFEGFTKDKVYEFDNGFTIDDDGKKRPLLAEYLDMHQWFGKRFSEVRE